MIIQPNGRLPAQPMYANSSVSPSHPAPASGLSSTPSSVRSVSPGPGSHGGADRIKQMEREIHLLRMSVNDKDAQLTQVSMRGGVHFNIKLHHA